MMKSFILLQKKKGFTIEIDQKKATKKKRNQDVIFNKEMVMIFTAKIVHRGQDKK